MHPNQYEKMVQASGKPVSHSPGQPEQGPEASPASPPHSRAPQASDLESRQDEWLRPKEAAAYIKSSESTLAKKRLKGNGPTYTKFGRLVLYAKRDLDEYLTSRRRLSTSDPESEAT